MPMRFICSLLNHFTFPRGRRHNERTQGLNRHTAGRLALTTSDVAGILEISENAVLQMVKRGTLLAIRGGRGKPLVYVTASVEYQKKIRRRRASEACIPNPLGVTSENDHSWV